MLVPFNIHAVLSMDFEKEINEILEAIPDYGSGGRRTMLFSVTQSSAGGSVNEVPNTQKVIAELFVHPGQVQGLLPDLSN